MPYGCALVRPGVGAAYAPPEHTQPGGGGSAAFTPPMHALPGLAGGGEAGLAGRAVGLDGARSLPLTSSAAGAWPFGSLLLCALTVRPPFYAPCCCAP